MRIVQRSEMKIVPGMLSEAERLLREDAAERKRLGMPPKRRLRLLAGRGETNYTLYFEQEWESLAQWEHFFELTHDGPANQTGVEVWDGVMESYTNHQFFTPWPYPEE